jgi:hypothetical protein
MKILRSSRMRATGLQKTPNLGTQFAALSSFSLCNFYVKRNTNELVFVPGTSLYSYFYCVGVDYPPVCDSDTTSGISSQCKDALYKLSLPDNLKKFLQECVFNANCEYGNTA